MTSYSRVMPNIKPYPQPQQQQPSMHYNQYPKTQQKLINLSVYRPAYHRIPSTPAISPRHQKDAAWAAMSPEVAPIIVPSMSPATIQPQFLNFYTGVYHQQPIVHRNVSDIYASSCYLKSNSTPILIVSPYTTTSTASGTH